MSVTDTAPDAAVAPHGVQSVLLGGIFRLLLLPGLCAVRRLCRLRRAIRLRQRIGIVQVKFRHVDHGQQFSVIRVHHNDGDTVRLFGLQRLQRELGGVALDVHIHADIEIPARHRLHPLLALRVHLHALGVRHRQDRAVLPFQIVLIDNLQPNDALIVAAGKAQHLGAQRAAGIVPPVVLIHFDARQVAGAYGVPDAFVHVALDLLDGGIFLHPLSDVLVREPQLPAQYGDHFLRVLDLAVDHRDRAHGSVVRQNPAVGVYDPPPRRLDAALPLVQLLGPHRIIF